MVPQPTRATLPGSRALTYITRPATMLEEVWTTILASCTRACQNYHPPFAEIPVPLRTPCSIPQNPRHQRGGSSRFLPNIPRLLTHTPSLCPCSARARHFPTRLESIPHQLSSSTSPGVRLSVKPVRRMPAAESVRTTFRPRCGVRAAAWCTTLAGSCRQHG
jgi:hypothetical protein